MSDTELDVIDHQIIELLSEERAPHHGRHW